MPKQKTKNITDKQNEYLKGLLSIWWDIPHKLIQYNDAANRVNKIIHKGKYKLGGVDEKAIKELMECVNMIT
jgi:hypothetical protein